MNNNKFNKGLLLLGLILTISSVILSVLLSWMSDDTFLKLEEYLGYKWMLAFFLIIVLILMYMLVYLKIFDTRESKDIPEKVCPSCGKATLVVVKSTIRKFTYKCKSCGFDHFTLKNGQTNRLKN